MKRFKEGDKVRLTKDLGTLQAGARGLIVEVYDNSIEGVTGREADLLGMDALFGYGVSFTPDVDKLMTHQGTWVASVVSLDEFHAGDTVPVSGDEIELDYDTMEVRSYELIPRDAEAIFWNAAKGREHAEEVADWIGGTFLWDEGQPEKTYYWQIQHTPPGSEITIIVRPNNYIARTEDSSIPYVFTPQAFLGTYRELEK